MDFERSEEQQAIWDMAFAFGQERIAPFAGQWEEDGTIPRALLEDIGALGLGGIYVSEEVGGSGLKRLDAALVFEALSMACPAVAAFVSIHNMCAWMIDRYGAVELKARLLPDMCTMKTIASYCLTEPGSGSDAAALRTKATKTNDSYVLNGSKAFISGGNYSDLYVVMCRTGVDGPKGISTVVVPSPSEGLSFGAFEKKMGWKAQPTTQVQFDNCGVPLDNLVGEEGQGFKYAMAGLDGGRLNIAACALGGAQSALDKTIAYMKERKAFGGTLADFQALQFKVADMETELQAARIFLHQAAWKLDNKTSDATKFCAMAKRFVTDVAFDVANSALQLHGGYGYLADYGIEKIVRDLRVHQILEGTNEIMRVIVARQMFAN
ncbi:acyl-CoA dehydrogenase family protein [Rhizobium sp. TH2]|uniref:acyl-CoA dehydrogenase family protein n=1 Tax=Rhizobium sp. TH2 TaxID=2775403 RepID=UPI0021576A57|nr:acyl-CoA dehydrogenase family protein [Rhizobium sp. TH2]UVC06963.1 acyl-CoA dehydrogenase family protein [Rhizobium sp. TH2]